MEIVNMYRLLKIALVALLGFCPMGTAFAATDSPKVVVMAFILDDRTNLPNAPEEMQRIDLLSTKFLEGLKSKGVNVVPAGAQVQDEIEKHSATYLYDRIETAIDLNQDTGADYLVIGVALKPTYLFVFPKLRIVDVKKRKIVKEQSAQLESSWSDKNTTIRTAEKLAQDIKDWFAQSGTIQN